MYIFECRSDHCDGYMKSQLPELISANLYQGVDMQARHETKCSIRGAAMDRLRTNREADLQWFVDFAMNPVTQNHLARYMEALKAKPKKWACLNTKGGRLLSSADRDGCELFGMRHVCTLALKLCCTVL